jgi:hypothetical protein
LSMANHSQYVYANWYFREASVAVYVTCLPGIWVLLREIFPKIQKLSSKGTNKPSYGGDYGNGYGRSKGGPQNYGQLSANNWRTEPKSERSRGESKDFDFELGDTAPITGAKKGVSTAEVELGNVTGDGSSTSSARYNHGGIRQDVTFTVERLPMQKN